VTPANDGNGYNVVVCVRKRSARLATDSHEPHQSSLLECTPGDWRAPPLTSKLLTIIRGHGRLSSEGRGAGRDASEITTTSNARAHVAVRRHCISLVGMSGRAAARGLGADLSWTALAAAPIAERIH